MLPPPSTMATVSGGGSIGGVCYCGESTVIFRVEKTGGVKVTAGHGGGVSVHVSVSFMFRVAIETRGCRKPQKHQSQSTSHNTPTLVNSVRGKYMVDVYGLFL